MPVVFLSIAVLIGLLLLIWIVRGGSKALSKRQGEPDFYVVDVAAFRNLLSQNEDKFLLTTLSRSNYRRVRRARLRAVQEYLLWIAANCATLIALLRVRVTDPELAAATDTEVLVQNALKLRMISLGFWALLWIEFAFPDIEMQPAAAMRRYEDVWRFAESYFRTRLSEPAIFAREAAG